MGILVRKHKGVAFTGIFMLSFIGAVASLSLAFVDTIWAVYMDTFLNSVVAVGFLSALLTLVSFLSYFLFIPLIEKSDKSKLYSISLLLYAFAYLFFAINSNFYFFIVLAFIITVLMTIRMTSYGIMIRDISSQRELSRNEGLRYLCINIAWLIGPLISGLISEKYGINMIFLLSAIVLFSAFMLFKASKIKDPNIKKRIDKNTLKNFLDFFKNKDRVVAYILGGGVNLWWSLIYLFVPLFMIRNGLGMKEVGIFLFAVPIPLVLFQYHFSKIAGKIGFKKIFKIGFFIPFILAFVCVFMSNIYLILGLLVLAGVGLSMLEATTEAYFFDIITDKEELRFYGPYNTTIDANFFIGKTLASSLLIFFGFKSVFLLYSFFMLLLFFVSFKAKNIIEKRRKGKCKIT